MVKAIGSFGLPQDTSIVDMRSLLTAFSWPDRLAGIKRMFGAMGGEEASSLCSASRKVFADAIVRWIDTGSIWSEEAMDYRV